MAKANSNSRKRTFLAVYLGTSADMKKWDKLPAKTRREREAAGIRAWMAWANKNRKSIVSMGGPLGTTKRIDRKGIATIRNQMGAFTVVRAPSHAAAAKLFKKHPHFTIFPGKSVEVMAILKTPGM